MKLNELNIGSCHEGLVAKKFTCVDLVKACFDAIREKDEELNSFISLMEDQAYESAEKVDKKISEGKKIGVLEGIPIAVKDNILVRGVKATAGSKVLSSYVAPYDATVIEKLKKAGAIIIGKTNMDEFAMGSSGETSFFGITKNPLDLTRVTGGSSSGSTASVCANETICALGTDTGGSVRQPASFCGVVGFKPTYGRNSRHGVIAMGSSFDQVGTITKTVRDAGVLFEAMSGKDPLDSTSVDKKVQVVEEIGKDITGMKIGVPKEYFGEGLDEKVGAEIRKAIAKLEKAGAEIIDISLPMIKYALNVYYILMPAEVSSNMARFDGVRFGYRAEAGNLQEMYLATRRDGFGDEVRRRIMLGTFVLSSGYYDAYYKKAQQVRRLIKEDFDRAFETVDCIISPTTPTTAFKLGEKMNDPMSMYLADIYTVVVNVAGLPAIVVPCGSVKKLPVGAQLIANQFEEGKLFRVAGALESACIK